jgi:hypothetical protein
LFHIAQETLNQRRHYLSRLSCVSVFVLETDHMHAHTLSGGCGGWLGNPPALYWGDKQKPLLLFISVHGDP